MAKKKKQKKGKKGGGQPGGQQVKGFRPGKEPAYVRKQRAKQQLGQEAPRAQERALDLVADRSPGEVRSLMNRWVTVLLVVGALLGVGGALLYDWSLAAGIVTHMLAAAAIFLWHRLRRQRNQLVELAEQFGKPSGG